MKPHRHPLVLLLAALWTGCAASPPVATLDGENFVVPATKSWLATLGGLGPEIPFAVASTPDGGVVTAGTFANRAAFGTTILEAPRSRDIFVARHSARGEVEWALALSGRPGDEPRGVGVDGAGNIWVTGFFTDTLTIPGQGTENLVSAGGADIFLVQLSAAGVPIASRRFGGALADNGNAVAVDGAGNLYLAGTFQGTMELGDRVLTSAGGRDAFVASFDSVGAVRWAHSFGGSSTDEARSLALGDDGGVWVAGTFQGSAGGLLARGVSDVFVWRLDGAGDSAATVGFGGSGKDRVAGLVVLSDGVALVGDFQNILYGPGEAELLESIGGTDVFALFLEPNGEVGSAVRFGGTVTDQALTAAPSGRDGVLIGGYFQGRADLDPGAGESWMESPGATNADGFVVELSATGSFMGSRQLGGDGVEQVLAVAAAGPRAFVATGLFKDRLALPWIAPEAEVVGRGKSDIFVVRATF